MLNLLTTASLTNFPTLTLPPASLCLTTSSPIHTLSCLLQTATWCNTSSAPPPLTRPATTLGLPSSSAAALTASLLQPYLITCFNDASNSSSLISSSMSASFFSLSFSSPSFRTCSMNSSGMTEGPSIIPEVTCRERLEEMLDTKVEEGLTLVLSKATLANLLAISVS